MAFGKYLEEVKTFDWLAVAHSIHLTDQGLEPLDWLRLVLESVYSLKFPVRFPDFVEGHSHRFGLKNNYFKYRKTLHLLE